MKQRPPLGLPPRCRVDDPRRSRPRRRAHTSRKRRSRAERPSAVGLSTGIAPITCVDLDRFRYIGYISDMHRESISCGAPALRPGASAPAARFFKARCGGFGPRGRRMRRGNVRAAILLLLEEEPRNGYQVMQEIEQRSRGRLAPEPGLGLPGVPAARRRGADPRRVARRRQRVRAHRRGPQPTSRRTASGSAARGSWPARACPRACASSSSWRCRSASRRAR